MAKTRSDVARNDWYRVASGKGVLFLHELRRLLGRGPFEKMMDSFGREQAGKEISSEQFQAHAERESGKSLKKFFAAWLQQPGLPTLDLERMYVKVNGKGFQTQGKIFRERLAMLTTVPITVETAKGKITKLVALDSPTTTFTIETEQQPQRVVVDRDNVTAKANGGTFSVLSFYQELEQCLIVYGTADEVSTNREAAEALQRAIIERWANYTVPIKTDKDVSDDALKSHHVLLIGRPDSNPLVQRFQAALPIQFGHRSFTVRGDTYAHAGSALIAAGQNPLNSRYSLVVVAGLSAESTVHAPAAFLSRDQRPAEVLVLPNKGKRRALVIPAPELTRDLGRSQDTATQTGSR